MDDTLTYSAATRCTNRPRGPVGRALTTVCKWPGTVQGQCWHFADERTDALDAVLTDVAESGAVVPASWRLEVANALQMAIRRKRIDTAFRDASLAALQDLAIKIDIETNQHA